MSDFNPAFERMIKNEGGYRLVDVKADRGGQTYAGIARNYHPDWPGWRHIDSGDMQNMQLSSLVRDFYRTQFWDKIAADKINEQPIADTIFDFAVNAGHQTAAKLTQIVVGTVPDGRIGSVTLQKINTMDPTQFILKFAVAKITRYAEICNKDKSQSKFLLGWVNRTLKGLV